MRQTVRVAVATGLSVVLAATLLWAATTNYSQTFDGAHGWTYTQLSCSGETCSNSAAVTGANCNGGTGGCVQASNIVSLNVAQTQTGYFKNSYTWQTLGVPAGSTVTQVSGSWWDKTSSSSQCTASTTAGMQIFDSANTTQATSAALAANINVQADTAGATHTGTAVNVNAAFQAATTTVTLRFNMNPAAAGAVGTSTCNLFGDSYTLTITSTPPSGRRGQTIVGWNRTPDGTLGNMWSMNIDTPNDAANRIMPGG